VTSSGLANVCLSCDGKDGPLVGLVVTAGRNTIEVELSRTEFMILRDTITRRFAAVEVVT
jgi:hypothetical protein